MPDITNYFASSAFKLNNYKGEWCVNEKEKIIFITINKCAGTSIRKYLKDHKYKIRSHLLFTTEHIKKLLDDQYIFYSVIRNPRDRYISGLNHFMFLFLNDYYQGSLNFIKRNLSNNKFIFDEHTLPQYTNFNSVLEIGGVVNLIKMDNNLSKNIQSIVKSNIELSVINSSKEKGSKNYNNFCFQMYELYCDKNVSFNNLYKKDHNLFFNLN